jgi:cytochrome c
MKKLVRSFFALGCLTLIGSTGCATATGEAAPSASTPQAVAAPTTVDEQIALGGKAYGTYCAKCHGDSGQGLEKAPPVVGAGALPLDPPAGAKGRTGQFHTALDIAQFVVANMPPAPRAKPSETEYWAILAFDLNANGIKPKEIVSPVNAASYVLHP